MPATKRRRHVRGALAVPLTLALTLSAGCAALFKATTQNVPVTTHPDGAQVWVDGKQVGTAPLTLKLDTRKRHAITVRRGDDIRTWQMRPHLAGEGASYLGLDAAVLVPAAYCAVEMFQSAAFYRSLPPGGFNFNFEQADLFLATGCLLMGAVPIAVDLADNNLYNLQPTEITVDFN